MQSLARLLLVTALALAPCLADAKVHITVDLDAQTIHVEAQDKVFDWKVSSGKPGYETPAGTYGVLWMDKNHHSDEYEGAYMPNAIFFAPGFAIHGFGKSPWGHAASHGCVRLPVAKSAILFGLVKAQGADVTITGGPPATVAADHLPQHEDAADGGFMTYPHDGARMYGSAPPPAPSGGLFGSSY